MQGELDVCSDRSIVCKSCVEIRFLRNWLGALIGEELCVAAVPDKVRNGIFPLRLLQRLGVEVNFEKTFEPVLSRQQCLQNLRYFLHVLSKKGVNVCEYKEKDLYLGRSQQVWGIVQLVFSEVYYRKCLESSETVYSWLSDVINSEVCSENLLEVFSDPSMFLTLLNSKAKNKESRAKGETSLKKLLKTHEIPCFFEDYDLALNTNFSFLYVQLWTIFTSVQENSLFCKSSTDSTSKDSVFDLNSSLEMFMKSPENSKSHKKPLQEPRLVKLNSKLNETDLLLCYLATPRIVQLHQSDHLKRVLLNITEVTTKSLNKLYMNIIELAHLESIFFFPLDQIEQIEYNGSSLTLVINTQKLKIVFKNQSECSRYLDGINFFT